MNLKLIISIARSLMLARLKQTVVAAAGVTFGITMFIALLSFMEGLNELLDGLMLNRIPHIHLYQEIQPNPHQPVNNTTGLRNSYNFIRSLKSNNSREEIYNSESVIDFLRKDSRVSGVAPKMMAPVFFRNGAVDIPGQINGIEVKSENRLFQFDEYVTAGNAEDIEKLNSIILGKGLADILLADVGDVVQVAALNGEIFPMRVVGYYQSGILEYDKTLSYTSMATLQKLKGKPKNYITDIQIKLKNINTAPVVAKEYARLFETTAEDFQTANASYETGSSIRTIISYAVGVVLLVVAGFGIYNILNMMIYEKMNTIAILKATGFTGKDVQNIFIVIALSIGVFGGLSGLLLGFGLSEIIDRIPFKTASVPNIKTYPVSYNPVFYLIGVTFSLITTFFAGWFPSRKAAHVDPVVIIRGK
jgi:lipoprotein-releasing system permease protein